MKKFLKKMLPDIGMDNEARRVAWVKRTLAEIPAGKRILDAGAGERRYKAFCDHLHYFSQDFAGYDGGGDGSGLQTGSWNQSGLDYVCDIIAIPEKDNAFDVILCTEVLEHLPDPLAAIQEFSRLLRPGGLLVLTAPFASLTHFAPFHFSTGFSRYFYEKHLPNMGFALEQTEANGTYFDFLAQEVTRLPFMTGNHTSKRMTLIDKLVFFIVLWRLKRFRNGDRDSGELLCYGYHVKARKL